MIGVVYLIKDLVDFSFKLLPDFKIPEFRIRQNKKYFKYINTPLSIDIETTSTIDTNGNKIAFPYCYQVGYSNQAYITRDYKVFYRWLNKFDQFLKQEGYYIHCLIHNLPYEFTFFSGFIEFDDIFAKECGKPLVCMYGNIRFLDSYQMSGYSLEMLSKNYTTTKKIKDIDYKLYRVPETKLTQQELRYCADDVIILNEYWKSNEVQKYIKNKGFTKIPLTNTAKVRMLTKSNITDNVLYAKYLYSIYPTDVVWDLLDHAFMGGVVKSNPKFTDVILHHIKCKDLTSSYPASILKYRYPTSQFIKCDITSFDEADMNKYCYLFRIRIKNLKSIHDFRTISSSKVEQLKNARYDNGRLISADELVITLTDIDFKYLFKFYAFDYEFELVYYAEKGYLPKFIIKTMVDLYAKKNELKQLAKQDEFNIELQTELLNTKGMLNSIYGMMVTGQHQFNAEFKDGKWINTKNPNYHKYSRSDFLSYQWGVWVTAYSRSCLYDGILMCSENGKCRAVYSDTDSVKYIGDFEKEFNKWNLNNDKLVRTACIHYGIKYEDVAGIGRYDSEPEYRTFKTLGCKRYYHESFNPKTEEFEEHITIAGISDKSFCKYALTQEATVLDFFKRDAAIPAEQTGKNTSLYCLNHTEPYFYEYEYEGTKHKLPIYNFIYLQDAPWKMTLSKDYAALLGYIMLQRVKGDD